MSRSKRSKPGGVFTFVLKKRWFTVFTSSRRRPAGVSRSASPYPVMLRIMLRRRPPCPGAASLHEPDNIMPRSAGSKTWLSRPQCGSLAATPGHGARQRRDRRQFQRVQRMP